MEPLGGLLEAFWGLSWGPPAACGERLRSLLTPPGRFLGPLWDIVEATWWPLEASWGAPGASWEPLGISQVAPNAPRLPQDAPRRLQEAPKPAKIDVTGIDAGPMLDAFSIPV